MDLIIWKRRKSIALIILPNEKKSQNVFQVQFEFGYTQIQIGTQSLKTNLQVGIKFSVCFSTFSIFRSLFIELTMAVRWNSVCACVCVSVEKNGKSQFFQLVFFFFFFISLSRVSFFFYPGVIRSMAYRLAS